MRLKKLTINNIASIEHAEIDFSASPLSDERLFLITGETGSGKSTIIDCLCLALYGTTPRLKSGSKVKYENGNDKEITITDTKQLLRRGSVKADIELTFDDKNGVPYIATWSVHRSRNKADGAIQDVQRSLRTEEGYSPVVDKKGQTEVNKKVKELLELDTDQFFRTVVLAQGKFAEFLTCGNKEKSDLLEKMTGTEIYSQVGNKIHKVALDKSNRCTILRGQMEFITPLNEDQKAKINEEIRQHNHEHTIFEEQLKKATAMATWLSDKNEIEKKLTEEKGHLAEDQERTSTTAHREQEQMVNDWEASVAARHQLNEHQSAQGLIAKLQQKQPDIQKEFDELCAALRAAIADIEAKQHQIQELNADIAHEEPNKAMYESMERIRALMTQWYKNKKQLADYSRDLEKDKQQLPVVQEEVKRTFTTAQELGKSIAELQKQYEALNTSQIIKEKDALSKACQALGTLKVKHDAVADTEKSLESLKTKLAETQNTLTSVNATLDGKRALKDKVKESLDRQTGWNELLIQAQNTLHEGDTCPVCGSTITQVLVPRSESELEQLRAELRQAEADLTQTEGQIQAKEQLIGEYDKQITDGLNVLNTRHKERDVHWQATSLLLEQCGKKADVMTDKAQADLLISEIEAEVEQLNVKLENANELNKRIQDEQRHLTDANQNHHKADLRLSTLTKSIEQQTELIKRCKEETEGLSRVLDKLLVMSDWQTQAEADEQFIQQLQQATDRYQKTVKTVQELARQIELRRTALPAMERSKANLHELTDNGLKTDRVPEDLDKRWSDLEKRHLELNTQLKSARDTADRAQQVMSEHLAKLPSITLERLTELNRHNQEEVNSIKQAHQTLNNSIISTKAAIATLSSQQAELNGRKPDFNEENPERLETIIEEKQGALEGLRTSIAELKTQLKNDEDNCKRLGDSKKELEAAELEAQQWQDFDKALGGSEGSNFRTIAQSYILGELLASANEYLKHFNNRYELMAKPGSLLILVRDLIQGDLTSVNTLSGGESFMVSLALALALSNMSGKVFSVDTLFIDEGFGSLSPDYLDNVMETLNRLYDMGGRRVGIISHVEMLKERVATQIKVFRAPNNNTVSLVEVTH